MFLFICRFKHSQKKYQSYEIKLSANKARLQHCPMATVRLKGGRRPVGPVPLDQGHAPHLAHAHSQCLNHGKGSNVYQIK